MKCTSHTKIIFPNGQESIINFTSNGQLMGDLYNLDNVSSKDKTFYQLSPEATNELTIALGAEAVPCEQEPTTITLHNYVYNRRKHELGYSTQHLAQLANVSVACINRLETGKTKNFDVNRLCNIARALGVDKDVLLYLAGVFNINSNTNSTIEDHDIACNTYNPSEKLNLIIKDYKSELEMALKKSKYPKKYINDVIRYAEFLYNKD